MVPKDVRIVLDSSVTAEVFRRGAQRRGWSLIAEYPPSENNTLEMIYAATPKPDSTVHYVEDHFVNVRYLLVRSPNPSPIVRLVETTFDCYDDEVLIESAEKAQDLQEMIDWMMSSTVLGDQIGRERLVHLIQSRFRNDNSGVRRAALIAAGWLEWPEFRARVEEMATQDPSQDVRRDAEILAEAYRLRDENRL